MPSTTVPRIAAALVGALLACAMTAVGVALAQGWIADSLASQTASGLTALLRPRKL
jgi:F0F1-type ATP synthase membrane subunit c/vacuolar-type H+-ATPase subunit K